MRIRGISTSHSKSSTDSGDFQDALDRNLDEMVGSIARLKGELYEILETTKLIVMTV